eukprot:CAMPEP_0179011112 /NCGR_PEP_ID=MMETSP0796-20121207/491_1 /TAXON_ID=73915 /ORGANISM="Pyrodinium bahamense, Strain pbaha01" /LENGTH=137 /DNA_ID=CAMNT_0020706471 /DNA_START=100 /DNA_END=510 /DNA_ORIENTATION=+
MWGLECACVLAVGALLGGGHRGGEARGSAGAAALAGFLLCGIAVSANLIVTGPAVASFLGSVHLVGQGAASNFQMPYAASRFPVASRGRLLSGLLLASHAGVFVAPSIGSALLQRLLPVTGAQGGGGTSFGTPRAPH